MNAYSNGSAWGPVTMDALMDTKRKLDALGPPPPSEVTVSPDLLDLVRDAMGPPSGVRPTMSAAPPSPFGPLGGFTVHVDERLPPRTWHPGKPRR